MVYVYIFVSVSQYLRYIYSGTVQRIVYYAYNPVVIEGIRSGVCNQFQTGTKLDPSTIDRIPKYAHRIVDL